jgi:hypothetical protein
MHVARVQAWRHAHPGYGKRARVDVRSALQDDCRTIFNNDSTLTSALLDRLLHHAETVVIEGKSFRRNEENEN